MKTITTEAIKNKKVLLRLDLDLPQDKEGNISDDYRLRACLPTLHLCLNNAQKTIIIGHLGRPVGEEERFSLKKTHQALKRLINQDIQFIPSGFPPGERWKGETPLSLQENIRFDPREEKNDQQYARQLAEGADVYVYEAFATYRACTSLTQIPEIIPTLQGLRFSEEVSTLNTLLTNPQKPTLLIASGAKKDKLEIIKQISSRFDKVVFGGLFAAKGDLLPHGYDLNEDALSKIQEAIKTSQTVVLNGPLGKYEDGYSDGTKAVFKALKHSSCTSILGGGDTLQAIKALGFDTSDFSFVSTGGGSMLEYLKTLSHPLLALSSVKC